MNNIKAETVEKCFLKDKCAVNVCNGLKKYCT